jgi:hypothetical protein
MVPGRPDWMIPPSPERALRGLPAATNQDRRDAIAAAVTARLHDQGLTEVIGEIVVPLRAHDAIR